jgi:cell division protein FtsZ
MGGGTGTGSISVVAELAKQSGALTVAAVTRPFSFEGNRRMQVAEEGINQLITKLDTVIIVPNDKLLVLSDNKTGIDGAFKMADEVLCNAVQAIAEVITVPGLVNLDFADVRAIMKDAGPAWMSVGRSSGQNRTVNAAKEALSSPLLDVSIKGAKGVLFNVVGSNSLTLYEVSDAAKVIGEAVDPEANIIFGVNINPNMNNEVKLTLIATGFASRDQISGTAREKEINRVLKNLKSEADLSVPAYMRYKGTYKR